MLNGPIIPAKSNDSAAGSAVDNSVIPALIIDEGFIDDVNILEEDNATQPWTVLVDIKGVTSVDLSPTEPPVAAPAAVTRSVASNNSGAGDCDHNACIIGTIVTAATAF